MGVSRISSVVVLLLDSVSSEEDILKVDLVVRRVRVKEEEEDKEDAGANADAPPARDAIVARKAIEVFILSDDPLKYLNFCEFLFL